MKEKKLEKAVRPVCSGDSDFLSMVTYHSMVCRTFSRKLSRNSAKVAAGVNLASASCTLKT